MSVIKLAPLVPKDINPNIFKCEYEGCGKYFNSKSNLIRHNYIHSGEKPFACNICSKSFNQQGNLNKHMKSHDNIEIKWDRKTEKEFKCTFLGCTHSYTMKSSLYNHMNKHKNDSIPNAIRDLPCNQIPLEGGLLPAVPGDGFQNLVLSVRAAELPCPLNNKMVGKCLHEGCNHVFDTISGPAGLRAHLFHHAPGLQAEARAMREIMTNLIAILDSWDIKSKKEKMRITNYVDSVKNALPGCLKSSDVEKFNNKVRTIHNDNVVPYNSNNSITRSSDFGSSYTNSTEITDSANDLFYDSDDERKMIEAILDDGFTSDEYGNNTPDTIFQDPVIEVLCCEPCVNSIQNIILQPEEEKLYVEHPLVEANNEILLGWMEHLVTNDNNNDNNISIQFQNYNDSNQKKKKKLISVKALKRAFGFSA